MSLPASTVRRLAFIKLLHRMAVQQSGTSPIKGTALLGLHDALEMFLLLACEHRTVDPGKKAGFEDYWGTLNKSLAPANLPLAVAMRRMNTGRVNLKHHGILPADTDFDDYKHNTEAFLVDATSLIFGVSYSDISLIDVIESDRARQALVDMHTALAANDRHEAVGHLGIALEAVIDDYEEKNSKYPFASYRFNRMRTSSYFRAENDKDRLLREAVETLHPVSRGMEIMALGLDLAGYARFVNWCSPPQRTMSGVYYPARGSGWSSLEPSNSFSEFGEQYVIESAMRLATRGQFDDIQKAPELKRPANDVAGLD